VGGQAGLLPDPEADSGSPPVSDPRDYDGDFYARLLRDTFAARLVRALTREDFATVFADPQQPSLFTPTLDRARPVLTVLEDPLMESPLR
jgi:hypothetical protein